MTEKEKEGLLFKRLWESQYVEDSSIVSSYEMEKLFNEAKTDYPCHNLVPYGGECTLDCANCTQVKRWKNKWFGE